MRRLCVFLLVGVAMAGCGPRQSMRDAIKNASVEDVKKHIRAGFDLAAPVEHSPFEFTPLHYAASQYGTSDSLTAEQQAVLDAILGGMSDLNVRDKEERTPLHACAYAGGTAVVQALLERGIDVNVADRSGETALHMAARKLNPDVCRMLLENGADPNAQDTYGDTPMHEALLTGAREHPVEAREIVDVLLAAGADINRRNSKGSGPLNCTMRGSMLQNYLIKRGAKN